MCHDPDGLVSVRSWPWSSGVLAQHIFLKEVWAAVNAVHFALDRVCDVPVCLRVDNTACLHCLQNFYCSSSYEVNDVLYALWTRLRQRRVALHVEWVPSADNVADFPSRVLQAAGPCDFSTWCKWMASVVGTVAISAWFSLCLSFVRTLCL